jgi:phosphatidate cytidylyltransferase
VTRLLSGVVLLAAVGSAAWFAPAHWLLAVAVVVAVLAFNELATLLAGLGAPVARPLGVVLTVASCIAAAVPQGPLLPVLLVALVFCAIAAVMGGEPDRQHVVGATALLFGAAYVGIPLGLLVNVHWIEGRETAMLLLLTIIVSDSSQYYAGRAFGRHRLAPTISPKKTIEGALGGFAGAAALMAWLGAAWLPHMPLAARVMLACGLVALGIIGDLFESTLKRAAQVKDSSALIPGHGGVLDRIDALLLAVPAYYVVLRYAWVAWR